MAWPILRTKTWTRKRPSLRGFTSARGLRWRKNAGATPHQTWCQRLFSSTHSCLLLSVACRPLAVIRSCYQVITPRVSLNRVIYPRAHTSEIKLWCPLWNGFYSLLTSLSPLPTPMPRWCYSTAVANGGCKTGEIKVTGGHKLAAR